MRAYVGHFPMVRGGPDRRAYNKVCGETALNMGSRTRFRFVCDSKQPLTGRYVVLYREKDRGLDVAEIDLYLNGRSLVMISFHLKSGIKNCRR